MPALREASPTLFTKEITSKGFGFYTPQDGSVCKIRVTLDPGHIIQDLDENREKEVVVGDVDEPIDRIVENCIRTMKEEEICRLRFRHPGLSMAEVTAENPAVPSENTVSSTEKEDSSNPQPDEQAESTSDSKEEGTPKDSATEGCIQTDTENKDAEEVSKDIDKVSKDVDEVSKDIDEVSKDILEPSKEATTIEIELQLLSYTREPEIWEMSITEKWRRASYHKQRGLELYSRGCYQYAFRRFGLVLKYVISLEHDVPSGQEEGMDIKGLKLSCYLNVAACQMRHHNFESVVINSTKALELQPKNAKALYRRGAACVQLQEYEKAKEDLLAAQKMEPKNQAIAKQLQILKGHMQKLDQYYASAMKKLFS